MRLVLTGAGTGGHLYPALAILEALSHATIVEALFIGTRKGLEAKVVPSLGMPFCTVWISGIRRRRFWGNFLFPLKMAVSWIQALFLLRRFRPDAVVGTGGYVSWPVLRAAISLGIPTFLQEQNNYPGLVTRVLADHMTRVYLSFEESRHYFKRQDHLVVTGNPIRSQLNLSDRVAGIRFFGLDPTRETLLVFGGSQGARGLNRMMTSLLPRLMAAGNWQMVWGCGQRWETEIRDATSAWSDRIRVVPFIENMAAAYAAADLVVCRAGASTIAEVTTLARAVVFVPFPEAAGRHQEANARVLKEAGAAELVLESEGPDRLYEVLVDLLAHPEQRRRMAERARKFGRPEAASWIAKDILTTLSEKDPSKGGTS